MTQIRLKGASRDLVEQVVALSTRYGIMTPYTSFLVLEPEAVQAPPPVVDRGVPAIPGAPAAPAAPAAAPAEAPAAVEKIVVVETRVVEQAVEALAAPERSGAAAVERAVAEQELASEAYAAEAGAEGQVRQVGSKAFVRRGDAWIDTTYDAGAMAVERIPFGEERYFRLLDEQPDIGPYLALGQRVLVVLEDKAYAIGWAGGPEAEAVAPVTQGAPVVGEPAAPAGSLPICPGTVGVALIGLLAAGLPARRRAGRR